MPGYAGLDVAQRATRLCTIDPQGVVLWTGKVATDPQALGEASRAHAQGLVRAVLESGALSGWLAAGLLAAGWPLVCIDARAAHGARKGRSKTDRSDALGLARLAQAGWHKAVPVRKLGEHRAALAAGRP